LSSETGSTQGSQPIAAPPLESKEESKSVVRMAAPVAWSHACSWLLLLDDERNYIWVGGLLRSLSVDPQAETERGENASVIQVRSNVRLFETVRGHIRQEGSFRLGPARVVYVCRDDVTAPGDPLAGQYGRLPRRQGVALRADVIGDDDELFVVSLSVRSTSPRVTVSGEVVFHLPDSPRRVTAEDGRAGLRISARETFTIGATIRAETKLEIDLANVQGVPARFLVGE
jgi:hypothetical protein